MSLVLLNASRLKPELRLAQAISEFEKDLSAEQKASLRKARDSTVRKPPDHQDVMRLTEEIDRSAARVLKSRRCFGPRFTNVLHAIQQFAALGDVIVGGSQNILACGVWSLVRMILLAVVNFSSYFEKLSALLMNVGRSAPRYELLHQLYPRSTALQSHLSEYLIVVVRLCHELLKMTRKSKFGQLVTLPGDADLRTYESELHSISTLIKEEVTLLMGQEVREQNTRIKTLLRSTEADAQERSQQERQDTYVRVLKTCSTYDYETTWKETRKLGMTTWFQQATEYQEWKSSADSATLVCTGKLGSGKSVMLANLVGDLTYDIPIADCPVAYFFCRHDISDSLLCSTIIRSLGRQLLRSIPNLKWVDQRFKINAQMISSDLILRIMLSLPRTFKAFFVLDGLDECSSGELRPLVEQLHQLQNAFELRICVACRSDVGNLPALLRESFAKTSSLTLPKENPEIKQFIESELYKCIDSGRLVLGDPNLSLEIADALLGGAQGMFLWVALQIEALCAETADDSIRRALTELPGTLQETFSRNLSRCGNRKSGRQYQQRTFQLVIAALRPLTTDQFREALSVTPGDDVWNPARHLNDVFAALASCGSLIMVEEENLTVRLIHHSVKQFLLSNDSGLTGGSMSFEDARKAMRVTVLTYLNYGVFETQLTTAVAPSIPAQAAPYKIIRSMDTPRTSRKLALMLLKSRGQSSVNIGNVVSGTMKQTQTPTQDAFKFYSYAKSSWLQHAWLISEHETVAYTMLLKVINRVLGSSNTSEDERTHILFWAARQGHPQILKLCFESNVDIESTDNEMRATPLFWAAANGRSTAVKTLAEQGANMDSTDFNGRTALCFAAERGLSAVVETLLDCGAGLETPGGQGWTAVLWAVYGGHEAVVTILIKRGANLQGRRDAKSDMPSPYKVTPLILAVEQHSRAGIVKILLENSADPDKRQHSTAMNAAIEQGDKDTLKVLLEHGVDPNIYPGEDKLTALRTALAVDDKGIFRLLLAHGADPNLRDDDGCTPLTGSAAAAIEISYRPYIHMLVGRNADLDIRDNKGKTALWYAALYGQSEFVRTLVENGADRNVMANDGSTCFCIGRTKGNKARIKILLDNGFDVELKDGLGRTPLADALIQGDAEVVRMLLEHGADPNA